MATTHYNFPTITGTDTIDGVNAINGLANAVDSALYGVANDIPDSYMLPVAGTTSLGGVRGAGQISVNPATGDMSINSGVINSGMIQTGAILGSNIATGAISSTNLNSSLQASIGEGSSALASISAAPQLSASTPYQPQGYLESGTIYSNYVVNEAAHLISVKASATAAEFNLPNSNTDATNMLCELFTLPVMYRPTSEFSQLIFVRTGADANPICFFLTVGTNGKVGITHINYSSTRETSFWGNGILLFFYGAQAVS